MQSFGDDIFLGHELFYKCICAHDVTEGDTKFRYLRQGANFVAGEKEIYQKISELNREKIMQETSSGEWQVNPPCSPHLGGVFESMIYSVPKRA